MEHHQINAKGFSSQSQGNLFSAAGQSIGQKTVKKRKIMQDDLQSPGKKLGEVGIWP